MDAPGRGIAMTNGAVRMLLSPFLGFAAYWSVGFVHEGVAVAAGIVVMFLMAMTAGSGRKRVRRTEFTVG